MEIRPYQAEDRTQVVALWKACDLVAPQNDPERDIERKLRVNPEWFLVGETGGRVIASCMAGYEGHRGWLNYLAVAPEYRRKGYARQLVEEVERLLLATGCPKLNLQIRSSNREAVAFYRQLGYGRDEVVSMGKRLIDDGRRS